MIVIKPPLLVPLIYVIREELSCNHLWMGTIECFADVLIVYANNDTNVDYIHMDLSVL